MLRYPPLFLVAVGLLVSQLAHAERFQSFEDRNNRGPNSYDPEVIGEIENLEKHINEKISCGGWIDDEELQAMPADAMTQVSGAPGRENVSPLGNIASGLGIRGIFTYPTEVYGWSSACSIYDSNYNPDQMCMIGPENATPQQCEDLYDSFIEQRDAQEDPPGRDTIICGDPNGPHIEFTLNTCLDWTETCTGDDCRCGTRKIYEDWGSGPALISSEKNTPDEEGQCFGGLSIQYPSCHFEFDANGNLIIVLDSPLRYDVSIASFYRHYGPINSFETLPDEVYDRGFAVESEGEEQRVAADCYEYYIEKDTLVQPARPWNGRCELYETNDSDEDFNESSSSSSEENGYGSNDNNANEEDEFWGTPEWQDPLKQKEVIAPDTSKSPYLPEQMNPPRPSREVPDPWVADEETNIVLLDMQEYLPEDERTVDPDDLGPHLNIAPEQKIIASRTRDFARTDEYDDATDPLKPSQYPSPDDLPHRVLTRWWNEQQKELTKITRTPKIQVVLPARYGVGLDTTDPILRYATKVASQSDGIVEIELQSGDDILGNVLSSLYHSFLLVPKEVKVPIIVPVASETEINVLIYEWRQWEIRYDQQGAASEIIARLETYLDQIREVRLLRNAITSYLAEVLAVQEEIRGFFANWYLQNAQNIQSWSDQSANKLAVQNAWRRIMKQFIRLSDRCELKWCSNTRYSAPVYSLLDPWLPGRPDLNTLLERDFLSLKDLNWPIYPDLIADFSSISLPKKQFYLPTLEVTQIRIDLPSPPLGPSGVPNANDYPDIPRIDVNKLIPDVTIFDAIDLPTVNTPELDARHYVPAAPTDGYLLVLLRLSLYELMVRQAANGYCRFRNSIQGREDQRRKIAHPEYDLRERIARLFARRAPLWKEDYDGRVLRKGTPEPTCIDDVVCVDLPPEKTMTFKWQVNAPEDESGKFIPTINAIRDATLPPDDSENPYYDVPASTLERYFMPELKEDEVIGAPILEIDLSVQAPSESSSSVSSP